MYMHTHVRTRIQMRIQMHILNHIHIQMSDEADRKGSDPLVASELEAKSVVFSRHGSVFRPHMAAGGEDADQLVASKFEK